MSLVSNESYVTLATNENYALGALTLGKSLRRANTNRKLTVLVTAEVAPALQEHLRSVFDLVEQVDVLNSNDTLNLDLLKRPELGVTFTKLHCWRLTQYAKCVFLDADTLVLSNVDELFERDELSAVTDIGWPDCFNSGVFVFRPSLDTYNNLLQFALSKGSFDGGDQGLLNAFFHQWAHGDAAKRLPFIYNMTTNASYSYAPAYKQFKEGVKIVHFIGAQKPWYYSFNLDTNTVVGNVTVYETEHLNAWWHLFTQQVLDQLNDETRYRLNTQLIQKSSKPNVVGQPEWQGQGGQGDQASGGASSGVVVGSEQHKTLWEHGQVDYGEGGRDAFSNIQAHLDAQLHKK